MKKIVCAFSFIVVFSLNLYAQQPEWIGRLPFTEDAFWGIGNASSEEEAMELARLDILMQLCSQVKAAITIKEHSNADSEDIYENMDSFFSSNSLRGAELADTYQQGDEIWVLMKYCDECGKLLMNTALNWHADKLETETADLMEIVASGKVSQPLIVERRLQELRLTDFDSQNILVTFGEDRIIIRLMNFLPFEAELTESQRQGMETLSSTLFKELQELNYTGLRVVGHANPEGKEGEEAELDDLSRNRAEVLSGFLRNAGLTVDSVDWKGGKELIGDLETPEGRGMNRRVEIIVELQG